MDQAMARILYKCDVDHKTQGVTMQHDPNHTAQPERKLSCHAMEE